MAISKDKKSVQAYVTAPTKEAIVKMAQEQDRSESYIAGKILDTAILVKEVGK